MLSENSQQLLDDELHNFILVEQQALAAIRDTLKNIAHTRLQSVRQEIFSPIFDTDAIAAVTIHIEKDDWYGLELDYKDTIFDGEKVELEAAVYVVKDRLNNLSPYIDILFGKSEGKAKVNEQGELV